MKKENNSIIFNFIIIFIILLILFYCIKKFMNFENFVTKRTSSQAGKPSRVA